MIYIRAGNWPKESKNFENAALTNRRIGIRLDTALTAATEIDP